MELSRQCNNFIQWNKKSCNHPSGSFIIEITLLLSNVMHMYSQAILIARERVDFNGDPTEKIPCWRQVSNLRPSYPQIFYGSIFAATPNS